MIPPATNPGLVVDVGVVDADGLAMALEAAAALPGRVEVKVWVTSVRVSATVRVVVDGTRVAAGVVVACCCCCCWVVIGTTLEADVVVGTGVTTVAEVVAGVDGATAVDRLVVDATGLTFVVAVVVGTMADVVTVALGAANEIC